MTVPTPLAPAEYGLIGFLLILVWKVLGVGQQLFLAKRGVDTDRRYSGIEEQTHYQQLNEIHQMAKVTERQKLAGDFQCAWKGRDEVRDLMELMRKSIHASNNQTHAIKALTEEMKAERFSK